MGRLHRLPLQLQRLLNRLLIAVRRLPSSVQPEKPGDLLFALRVKIGISQAEAAKRAGLTQQYWYTLESGKRDAGIATWRRAFDGLDCEFLLLPRPRRDLKEWRVQRALEGRWAARSIRQTSD